MLVHKIKKRPEKNFSTFCSAWSHQPAITCCRSWWRLLFLLWRKIWGRGQAIAVLSRARCRHFIRRGRTCERIGRGFLRFPRSRIFWVALGGFWRRRRRLRRRSRRWFWIFRRVRRGLETSLLPNAAVSSDDSSEKKKFYSLPVTVFLFYLIFQTIQTSRCQSTFLELELGRHEDWKKWGEVLKYKAINLVIWTVPPLLVL